MARREEGACSCHVTDEQRRPPRWIVAQLDDLFLGNPPYRHRSENAAIAVEIGASDPL